MGVHSTAVLALEGAMQTSTSPDALPIEAGDAEWVADLFETFRAGDVEAVIDQLDDVVRLMRRAARARRMLATVDPLLLREGLALCQTRGGVS